MCLLFWTLIFDQDSRIGARCLENVNSAYALYDALNLDALNQSPDIHKKALLICSNADQLRSFTINSLAF